MCGEPEANRRCTRISAGMNHTRASTWTPLFSDDAAQRYRNVIHEVVDCLDAHDVQGLDNGKALLCAYTAHAEGDEQSRERAEQYVEAECARMEDNYAAQTLYSGIVGCAWLSAHTDTIFGNHDDSAYEDVDAFLVEICRQRGRGTYDLISGWVGFGVYFLERFPHPSALNGIEAVLEVLKASCEEGPAGTTWFTPPQLLPPWQRAMAPEGYYNVGMAHGVPGVIGFLSEVQRLEGTPFDVRDLLRRSTAWVVDQQRSDQTFPAWIPRNRPVERNPSRVAWCYGELGVSVALLAAARALNDDAVEEAALASARHCAERRHSTGVKDAGLCHGAAGNAHLFNRLYQATRDPVLRDAAVFWFERALSMRVAGTGVAGYTMWTGGPDAESTKDPWTPVVSFLTGASGVALAFLGAIAPVAPDWDRLLLSRLPPIPRA